MAYVVCQTFVSLSFLTCIYYSNEDKTMNTINVNLHVTEKLKNLHILNTYKTSNYLVDVHQLITKHYQSTSLLTVNN